MNNDPIPQKKLPLYLKPVPFLAAVVSAMLGVHFYTIENIHNFVWESLYGIGYRLADLALYPNAPRTISILGLTVWPLLTMSMVGVLTNLLVKKSRAWRIGVAGFFVCSLVIWINQSQANWLCARGWPVYANYFFVDY